MRRDATERGEASRDDWSVQRRRLLQAAGAAAALTAVGGTASARGDDEKGNGRNQGNGGEPPRGRGKEAIDPNLGYVALTPDEKLPVEPDHVVEVLIRPPGEGEVIPEFHYEPTGLAVDVGDVVAYYFATPGHTVSAYHPYAGRQQRIPDRKNGLAWFSSPYLGAGATWLYRFDRPGVYDYYCGPHEIFGHVGRVVAGGVTEAPPVPDPCGPPEAGGDGDGSGAGDGGDGEGAENVEAGDGEVAGPPEPELRPPAFTGALVLRDPALDPKRIVDSGAVPWEDIGEENKQLFFEPVTPDVCSSE